MRTLEQVTAGEDVVMTDHNDRPRRVKIERVGRINVYVVGDNRPFDRKTGRVKDNYGHSDLWTLDGWGRVEQADKAATDLREFGVDVRGDRDRILAIHAALKPLIDAAKVQG